MAKGDVAGTAITSVTTGANLDFQPSSGVEVMLAEFSSDGADVDMAWYDGSNKTIGVRQGDRTNVTASAGWLRMFTTNAIYLRMNNATGGTLIIAARGITTK